MEAVYEKLRERIDGIAKGLPATKKGAELELLRQMFDQEDAELYINMKNGYETPAEFASRLGMDQAAAAGRMESMAKRGLLFRLRRGGEVKYRPNAIVHGIWEANVNNLDAALVKNFNRAFAGGLGKTLHSTEIPLFRVVPLQTEVAAGSLVLPYDDSKLIVENARTIALAECICRKIADMDARSCGHTRETCLSFDHMADYSVENGFARYISKEEAQGVLDRCREEGLLFQVSNSRRVEVACCCCPCCCGLLISLNAFGGPSREVISNYTCRKDDEICTDCEICLERCAVKALSLSEGRVDLKLEKCIGCGLCVTVCPTGALSLVKKPRKKSTSRPGRCSLKPMPRSKRQENQLSP
jgi:Pyruvate/2-oxoacid:ferredoxin oxidoreductase delta subunit